MKRRSFLKYILALPIAVSFPVLTFWKNVGQKVVHEPIKTTTASTSTNPWGFADPAKADQVAVAICDVLSEIRSKSLNL